MDLTWVYDYEQVDLEEVTELYRIAPLGDKPPEYLATVFPNTKFKCFVYAGDKLVGVGRAVSDGADVSYICDVAVHPEYQGQGIGKSIIQKLVSFSEGYNKIILYAAVGKEGFYQKLGFYKMNTAMAIFQDQQLAVESGTLSKP